MMLLRAVLYLLMVELLEKRKIEFVGNLSCDQRVGWKPGDVHGLITDQKNDCDH